MEAGELIDSADNASTHTPPPNQEESAMTNSHDQAVNPTRQAILDLDIINDIPSMDATPSPAAEQPNQRVPEPGKDLPNGADAAPAIDLSFITNAFSAQAPQETMPAPSADLSAFDSLLASLIPSTEPANAAASSAANYLDSIPASASTTAPTTVTDEHTQSFVDSILRQANLYTPVSEPVEPTGHANASTHVPEDKSALPASGSDDALAASLEQFMASLQARVSSSLTTDTTSRSTPVKSVKLPKKPKRVLGKRKHREIGPVERLSRVRTALTDYISSIDTLMKPALVTGPIPASDPVTSKMTTIRCMHASVAQKSYGSEKRYFQPPPIVTVTGPLRRYAQHGLAVLTSSSQDEDAEEEDQAKVSFVVKGEGSEHLSDELVATLDERLETKIRSLHVTPTGRSKTFRLQLNLLRPGSVDPQFYTSSPTKKPRTTEPTSPAGPDSSPTELPHANGLDSTGQNLSRLPRGAAWASFESAPVTIVSKSSKKTAKPRGSTNQIQNGSLISLFNRINSQTARTKYMQSASDGRLLGHNGEWSTYRVTLISRPALADVAGAEEGSVTYGSTIVLTDVDSGFSSDPLVVCKVDKGQVQLPQIDPPAELLTAGSGNRSRRVPIDPGMKEKLAKMSQSTATRQDDMPATYNQTAHTADKTAATIIDLTSGDGEATKNGAASGSTSAEDLNLYGPVGQMQKVALMRFVPSSDTDTISGSSEHLESDFSSPRSFLCANTPENWRHMCPQDLIGREPVAVDFASTHQDGIGQLNGPSTLHDLHRTAESNSVAYVSPKTSIVPKVHSSGTKVVDEVDDAFVWTVIGVSRFEYSYFDTSATQASKDEGPCEVSMTPFPLITSMPTYDQTNHTIRTSVTNFIVPGAITSSRIPLDVWIGSLGPLKVEHSSSSTPIGDDPEHLVTVHLPPIHQLLANARPNAAHLPIPAHFLLPLLFVNDSDGTVYQSGRHVVCEDLVQLMQATGHETSADMLNALGFGLGPIAGPPAQGAWSVRVI